MRKIAIIFIICLALPLCSYAPPHRPPQCHELLADVFEHVSPLDFEQDKDWIEFTRVQAILNSLISDKKNDFLARLQGLLTLPKEKARAIAETFITAAPHTRVALLQRLQALSDRATEADIMRFYLTVADLKLPYSELPFPRIEDHPELLPFVQEAKDYFLQTPHEALKHVIGEADEDGGTVGGPKNRGGGHLLATWEQVAQARINAWDETSVLSFEQVIAEFKEADLKLAKDFYEGVGFDVSRKGLARHFVIEQSLWGIEKKQNEVICLWLPRPMFNSKTWKLTTASAKSGISPIGGKSLFPVSWSLDKISKVIVSALESPTSFVRRPKQLSTGPFFYLGYQTEGIEIEVGIQVNRVGTAFPACCLLPAANLSS